MPDMDKFFAFVLFITLVISGINGDEDESLVVSNNDFVCSYAGKNYKLGERIIAPDAACFLCHCFRGWTEPSATSCAIIDCPWRYYRSKPFCKTEYVEGECCPKLQCHAPPPKFEAAFVFGKRNRESTGGYNITTDVEKEVTLYCIGNSTQQYTAESARWILSTNGSEQNIENGTRLQISFFEPATWALYITEVQESDDGFYTCTISGNPPEIETTRLIVRTESRLPVVDPVCLKPAFADHPVTECQLKWSEHPWYYNTTLRECVQHTEVCTWGDENVFGSKSECWNHCLDDCYAQPEPGPCKGEIERYYYDDATDRCFSFLYGGCQGNFNNFKTVEACEDSCASVKYRSIVPEPTRARRMRCSGKCQWREWLHYVHQGCSPIYEDSSCCPVRFNCKNPTRVQEQTVDSSVTCNYENRNYSGGEMIALSDLCLSCPCIENFNGTYGPGCKPLHCNTEEMDEKLAKGCLPIYLDDKCCPVDWQCPPSMKTTFRQGGKDSLPKDPPEQQCFYGGQGYVMGFELLTGHSRCLYCACLTPPTFSCTAFSCPEPPSALNETLRCTQKYAEDGECCSKYDCWSVFEDNDRVGLPKTEKEKRACSMNSCSHHQECLVNYTQCHFEDCKTMCQMCAVPMCVSYSKYHSPINVCPYCLGPKTPEDACEWNPTYCPTIENCVVGDENMCATRGHCEPACRIEEMYATVRRAQISEE